MARAGINKVQVKQARSALLARGAPATIDAVRIELGNTGSKSTIQRLLKELNDETAAAPAPPSLSTELAALMINVAERLQEDAQTAMAFEQQQLIQQRREFVAQQQHAQEYFRKLEADKVTLSSDLQTLRQSELDLRQAFQVRELECARLAETCTGLQRLLDQHRQQVSSLEEKHQHARTALEHYRDTQQHQRTQELRRHEGDIQLLRQEVRELQKSLGDKQSEIIQVVRDNERLAHEYRTLATQHFEVERDLQRQRSQTLDAQSRLPLLQTELHKASVNTQAEKAALVERLKQQLAEKRLLRRQVEHLTQRLYNSLNAPKALASGGYERSS